MSRGEGDNGELGYTLTSPTNQPTPVPVLTDVVSTWKSVQGVIETYGEGYGCGIAESFT